MGIEERKRDLSLESSGTSSDSDVTELDSPDAGWVRNRLLPPEKAPQPRSRSPMSIQPGTQALISFGQDHGDGPCPCVSEPTILRTAVGDVSSLPPSPEDSQTAEQALQDLILNSVYQQHVYEQIIGWIKDMLVESYRRMEYLSAYTRLIVHPPDRCHVPNYLLARVLRVLSCLEYETESPGSVQCLEHVTFFAHAGMPRRELGRIAKLAYYLEDVTLVDAWTLLRMSSHKAGTIIELMDAARAGNVSHYQSELKSLWDQGDADLLQTLGFKKQKHIYTKLVYTHISTKSTDDRGEAISYILKSFHRPTNTLV